MPFISVCVCVWLIWLARNLSFLPVCVHNSIMSLLGRVCAHAVALSIRPSYVCLYALCIYNTSVYARYVGFIFKELTLIRINFDNFR